MKTLKVFIWHFSSYCGLAILHSLMYKKVADAQYRSKLSNELMMYHMKVREWVVRSVSNDVSQRPHSRPAEVTLAVSLSLSQSLIVVSCSPLRVVSCLLSPVLLTCVCCRCPRRRSADWSPPPCSLSTTNCRTSASSTSAPGLSRRATRVMIMRDLSSH